ncbi:MAG: putative inner membrane protein [Candidatus Ozemobacter sibiricus]|jgi:AAA family ATP:ADP antiporter|uniref:Putative inner membrane protein n=1 Tax=Candidatus Ozemobacter sibiricus TaxID=2268124 RepID=A0A367ZSB6_9BACT|nr:MAG: putative inner membrane protein [Candidatus Ozemobacter sibiricus]
MPEGTSEHAVAVMADRPVGERRMAWVAVVGFGFLIMTYYVLKPIRESLAIELGSQTIPALNILSMLSLIGGNALYTWIVGRFRPERFIPGITWVFVVCLLGFWGGFQVISLHRAGGESRMEKASSSLPAAVPAVASAEAGGAGGRLEGEAASAGRSEARLASPTVREAVEVMRLEEGGRPAARAEPAPVMPGSGRLVTWAGVVMIAGYFVWVNLFALFSISMFWSYVNDVFTTAQGKRLYGMIGYGGLVGGLAGGLLTAWLASAVGTTHLLLVAAALLMPTAWLPAWLPRPRDEDGTTVAHSRPAEPRPWDGLTCTFRSSLLLLLALEMFCYTFASSLFSYQVNALVEETLPSRDLRTVYWANLYNAINGVSLLTQFTLTWGFMRLTVPVWGLLVLPVSQILGSLWLSTEASLVVAATVVVFRYATNYSTGRALRELMFTLVTREEKYQGKGFIDTLVFRAGDGLASGFLLWGLHGYGPGGWIDATIIGVMAVSAGAIVALAIRFKASLQVSAAE